MNFLRPLLPLAILAFLPMTAGAEERLLVEIVENFCADCHDADASKGDIDFLSIVGEPVGTHAAVWEKALRQLDARQMPPIGKDRPDAVAYAGVVSLLEQKLDAAVAEHPNPGRTDTLRRLNRTEYRNAIRDLLALDIDAATLLPADESSHGFDNVTVGELSPTLLDRYITAAQKISRLAVGSPSRIPAGETIRVRPDITQEGQVEGLPLGTRGGALIPQNFPRDGEYEIVIRLARDRNEQIEGLRGKHTLEVLLDGEPVADFAVQPPKNRADHTKVDAHLKKRIEVKAGPHALGVTFRRNGAPLEENLRQPYSAHFNTHRHPRLSPAIYEVSITGPYHSPGVGETPSRQRIFTSAVEDENARASEILGALARRAFRRPVVASDLEGPLGFYRDAREAGEDFEAGLEAALTAILVSRAFLFRVEKDPADLAPGTAYPISDLELASRLSFFLWSSLPDEELLAVAERGALRDPDILTKQTRRMLADPRASSLVTNFADQWLYLRNLDSITPDGRLFPDFDDNLRQAFRRETEMLFETVLREDRSVLDLLRADFTFLNERLAVHYGIPHIYGERFRKVALAPESRRGGILRHGSILTVTSYATRTSPVIRGHWILKNLLGTPPPPPPPDVPALEDNTVSATLPMRERLAEHRANPACASCHNVMDPVGFALENFDAVGRWRTMEEGRPVDASGGLSDGSVFAGVEGLEQGLLARPEIFVRTLSEKLLTYALGRGVETFDAAALRAVVRGAKADDYRFSALILGIVRSPAFTLRNSAPPDAEILAKEAKSH